MRAIWSGAISFGLINIPVKLYSAVESKERINFDMLEKNNLCPINYVRVCRATGKEVPWENIVKGYEYEKGDYVILTDEDFKKADVKKTQTIDVLDFASENEIDLKLLEKPYYLEPTKESAKPYSILREALKKSKKVGIAKMVLRNREHLGFLKPEKNIIVFNQMRFQSEIRKPEVKIPEAEVAQKELEMAIKLIDELSRPFEAGKYSDTYTQELKRIINEKVKGKVPKPKGEVPIPTEVPDILSKLKESLEMAKKK